jgi:hypothetical protein
MSLSEQNLLSAAQETWWPRETLAWSQEEIEEEDGVGSIVDGPDPGPRGPVGPRGTDSRRAAPREHTQRRRAAEKKHAPCTGFTACKYNVNWSVNVAYLITPVWL